jgi:hypothetical protein
MPELSARSVHATDQVLAVLASEYPLPVSTRMIEERTGYGPRYGQLTYRMLTRLARSGEAGKMTVPDMRSRCSRLAAAPQTVRVPGPDAQPPGRDRDRSPRRTRGSALINAIAKVRRHPYAGERGRAHREP